MQGEPSQGWPRHIGRWKALEARREARYIASLCRKSRSLALGGGGLIRGGNTASRSGPSHGLSGSLRCSPILVNMGRPTAR